MTTPESSKKERAFQQLQDVVLDWRKSGRKTTSAGLKPTMRAQDSSFDEGALGFPTFRDFLNAAATAGFVQLQINSGGHTVVLLPGEARDADAHVASPQLPVAVGGEVSSPKVETADQAGRLKQDVWTAFVDWNADHARLWDREVRRSFMFPIDSDTGYPAWLSNKERFVAINPADREEQTGWMREWAEHLPDAHRLRILDSLEPHRPLGQFSRELSALGLTPSWRAALQERVFKVAADWAHENGVALGELIDRRARRPAPQKPVADVRQGSGARAATSGTSELPPPSDSGGSEAERLRAVLHRVIDRMSMAELLNLPIRAEHLLDR